MTAELKVEIEQRIEILRVLEKEKWEKYKEADEREKREAMERPSQVLNDEWYKVRKEFDALKLLLACDPPKLQIVQQPDASEARAMGVQP
jgi:hypothetical protein